MGVLIRVNINELIICTKPTLQSREILNEANKIDSVHLSKIPGGETENEQVR